MHNATRSVATGREPAVLELRTAIPVRRRIYTTVCDASAPLRACHLLETLGALLAKSKFTLRSGGSSRGELSVERGAASTLGNREIYLPWAGFNHHASHLYRIPEGAFKMCSGVEPRWLYMGRDSRKMMARICLELLGKNLDRPSLFLLCWTPNGRGAGDCIHAVELAQIRGIPVLDIGKYDSLHSDEALEAILDFLRPLGIETSLPPAITARQIMLPA